MHMKLTDPYNLGTFVANVTNSMFALENSNEREADQFRNAIYS